MSSKITIDKLAEMLNKQFAAIDENFLRLEKRIDELESSLRAEIRKVSDKLDLMEARHERRLNMLEDRTITLKKAIEKSFGTEIAW